MYNMLYIKFENMLNNRVQLQKSKYHSHFFRKFASTNASLNMGIRVNKAMTILNIGTETVVEYLKSKPGLEPTKELNPNSKLTDAQFEALAKEFAPDMHVKEKAKKLFQKKSKKEKETRKQQTNEPIATIPPKDSSFPNQDEKGKDETSIVSVAEPQQEDRKESEVVTVLLSKLRYETNCITYKRGSSEFALWETGISRYVNSEKSSPNINNVSTKILLNHSIQTFRFVDASVLPFLLDLSTRLENEKFEKHLKNVEKKKEQEQKKKEKQDKAEKKIKPTKIELRLQFHKLKFSYGLISITHKKKSYIYRNRKIWNYEKILGQVYSRISKARKNAIKSSLVKVEIDPETGTFVFIDFDVCKYVNNLRESFLPERKNSEVRKEIQPQVKAVPRKSSKPLQSMTLGAGNIRFYNGYFLIYRVIKGEIDNSVTPCKINDADSHEILNLVHNFFEQRFEQMRIMVKYDETQIHEPAKSDLYQLSKYVRTLKRNLDVKGEWWEEVQNARKRTFGQCLGEPVDSVKKKIVKAKNEYLYNLASLQNDKKLIRVYEINHGKEEDAFIFTIAMPNNRCAVIFENASNDASTTTWVFEAKNENYEACVNLVFDYFTDYTISAKRSSLRDSDTNPPYKFKAEDYTFIDHNDLGQWLKKLNKVLERTSVPSDITFVPGLNIPQSSDIRSGHGDAITTKNLHNELMRKLYDRLCVESGKDNVGTEIRVGVKRIDAVVKGTDFYDLYEVKTALNPFDCVTEALGQLCQYAYLFCRDKIGKMVIAGASEPTREVEQYLATLRKNHSLSIYYIKV